MVDTVFRILYLREQDFLFVEILGEFLKLQSVISCNNKDNYFFHSSNSNTADVKKNILI